MWFLSPSLYLFGCPLLFHCRHLFRIVCAIHEYEYIYIYPWLIRFRSFVDFITFHRTTALHRTVFWWEKVVAHTTREMIQGMEKNEILPDWFCLWFRTQSDREKKEEEKTSQTAKKNHFQLKCSAGRKPTRFPFRRFVQHNFYLPQLVL